MKYLRLFESFEDIKEICKKYSITNYTINQDGSIDVNEYVDLSNKGLTKLPLKFNKINGDFYCDGNELTSFEFSPRIIRGDFDCEYNNIKTFEYFPIFVKVDFLCYSNPIYEVWRLFHDTSKIELLNDFDIFRDEYTEEPAIVMDRLNDFLLTIGKDTVEYVHDYKNI